MLSVHHVSSIADKKKYLQQFDTLNSTWVVPDLKAKLELQKYDFTTKTALEENSILRATDLWQKLLDQTSPGWRVIDRTQTEILLLEWVDKSDRTILKTTGSVSALLDYISRFLPVLTNESAHELMLNWLEQNPRANQKWRTWYLLSKKYFHKFYQNEWCETQWVSGVLLDLFQEKDAVWPKALVFDLSTQVSVTEMECIKLMSRSLDIHVLVPDSEKFKKYWEVLYPYSILEDSHQKKVLESSMENKTAVSALKFERYPTMLAEVKSAVSQVSLWKSEGIKNSEIAIVAPNIEVYWPVLRRYLDTEQISYQKDVVYRTHSHPKWLRWRAQMKMAVKHFDFSDLELAEYHGDEASSVEYSKFKNTYHLLFDESDLKRSQSILKRYSSCHKKDAVVSRDEFVEWALEFLDSSIDPDHVILQPIQNIVARCPRSQQLSLKNWLRLFEAYSIFENTKESADFQGVHCLNLTTCEFVPAKKWIVLGVCDRELSGSSKTSLYTSDVVQIFQDIGFHLNVTPYWVLNFALEWLATQESSEIIYMAPATDFSGETLGASPFWLEGALREGVNLESVTIKNDSQWDMKQREVQNLKVPLVKGTESPVSLQPSQLSFSATRLNHFFKCPFIYYSEKLLKLRDLPDLDMDIDPLTKGNMTHAFLERLTAEPVDFDCSEEKMEMFLEECRKVEQYNFADERLWQQAKSFYKRVGKNFLKFEKNWRAKFPQTKTMGREVAFKGYWNLEEQRLMQEGEVLFRGAIDRIDVDGLGHQVVVDYKASASSASNYSSWINKGVFQLVLYSQALQESLTQLDKGTVVGAYFFNVKEMKRNLGFTVTDIENGLVEVESRARNQITQEKLETFFEQINKEIHKIVEQALKGGFQPQPKELEHCNGCSWRTLCRAPHLQ